MSNYMLSDEKIGDVKVEGERKETVENTVGRQTRFIAYYSGISSCKTRKDAITADGSRT